MPRIALVNTNECQDACHYCSGHILIDSISDWDEVTDSELNALRQYYTGRILVRDTLGPVLERVRNAVVRSEQELKRRAEEEEAKRKKRAEKKLQKEMLNVQKKEEDEKKLYEKLREKFECR